MPDSLKSKTAHGIGWSLADNVASQGITFLVGLVLARLLTPEEYGLIGIITIFIAVFNSLVDSGFSNALIRKDDVDETDYGTVFISNLALSVLLFAVLFVCAPAIGHFFRQPALSPLTRVMGSIVLINALAIIQRTRLVKNIDFKTQTKVSIIASSVSGVVGIGMAFAGCGVWSLAGQQISRQTLNTTFLWIFNRWIPSLKFSKKSFRELFGFGWKLMVSGVIDTIWRQIYQIVIGKCYSAQALGQYTRAEQFSSIFSSNITAVVQRVSYPVLSSIQNDVERLKSAYRKVIKVTMLVTFALMLGLAGAAEQVILVLVGDQWLPCVPFLQIVCFSMMLYPLHAINLNMLQVLGRSDLFLKLEIIKKIVGIGPILLGIFGNIYWMLIASVFTGFVAYYLNAYYSGPFLKYSITQQILDIAPDFGVALCMAIIVYAISYIKLSAFVLLPIQLSVGAAITIGLCKSFKLEEYKEIQSIVLSAFNFSSKKGLRRP